MLESSCQISYQDDRTEAVYLKVSKPRARSASGVLRDDSTPVVYPEAWIEAWYVASGEVVHPELWLYGHNPRRMRRFMGINSLSEPRSAVYQWQDQGACSLDSPRPDCPRPQRYSRPRKEALRES